MTDNDQLTDDCQEREALFQEELRTTRNTAYADGVREGKVSALRLIAEALKKMVL